MLEFSERNIGKIVVVSVIIREIVFTGFIILVHIMLTYRAGLVE